MTRREGRLELFRAERAHRVDFAFTGIDGTSMQPGLEEFLRAANFHFVQLPQDRPVRARVAMFPTLIYVHAIVPESRVVWPRDKLSMDRSLLLMALKGTIEVEGAGSLVRDLPAGRLHLVAPGDSTVHITVSSPECEVFYVSIDTNVVAGVSGPFAPVDPRQVDALTIGPLLAFSTQLCALPTGGNGDLAPLQSAAESIARALTGLVAAPRTHESTYEHAVRIIQTGYARTDLTPVQLAVEMGISVRTLQLAFAANASTPTRVIREIRTQAALELRAADPTLAAQEIARRSGFGSVKTLRRVVKFRGRGDA